MFRLIRFIILFCCPCLVMAQKDTLNQKDEQGLKQGYWIFYGKDFPEKGFCDSCKIEEGNYLDDRKDGIWTFYHMNDTIPRLMGTFVNGRPDGNYKKFYANGKIAEEGYSRLGNHFGQYRRYYESGCLAMEKFYNENGNEHGAFKTYYDFCDIVSEGKGQIEVVYDKIDGVSFSAHHYYPSGCLRQYVLYGIQGEIVDIEYFLDTCSYGIYLPDSLVGTFRNQFLDGRSNKKFDPNGFNKVYNYQNLLLMEGDFKEGKLWEGKLYKYTDGGNLFRTELWREGTFFSVLPVSDYERSVFEKSMIHPDYLFWNQIDSADISEPLDWELEYSQSSSPFALGGYMAAGNAFDP